MLHRFTRTVLMAALCIGGASSVYAQSGSISVSALPAAMVADNHSTVTIRIAITNGNGNAVQDGSTVLLTSDLGRFREEQVQVKDGLAMGILVAGNVSGTATITARVLGSSIAPATTTVEFYGDRDQLNSAKDYVEIVSAKALQFSPADRIVQADDPDHKVRVRYRDLIIEADKIQLNCETYEFRAIKAKVKRKGQAERSFAKLNIHLDSNTGYGITTVREPEVTGIASVGRVIILKSDLVEHYGLVSIKNASVTALHNFKFDSYFAIEDFDSPPALITARKAVVYRNKEIQFQQAELYAGDARVLRLPLYRAPLTGEKRLFTEQILNVNDNQVAVTYPYYLSLKPGETSFLRFHMGDNTGLFGTSNRPQLDYEIDWDKGAENYGGFLFSGIGQSAWGVELHQYLRLDDRTTGFAQIESPATRSLDGSLNMSHTLNGGYSANLSSSITQSLIGTPLTDQSTSIVLQRDPLKVGTLPFRLSYGLTASHISTTAPIAIQRQDAYGIQGQLTMLEQKLDKNTRLDGGFTVSHLMGTNVDGGLTLAANVFLRTHVQDVNFGFGYSFTEDALQSERVGQHQITGLTSYNRGNLDLSLHGSTSLDIQNLQYTSSVRYRMKKLWSVAYTSSFYKYLGTSFLDYNFGLYYTYMGSKQVGIIWSYRTNRLGLQLYGD